MLSRPCVPALETRYRRITAEYRYARPYEGYRFYMDEREGEKARYRGSERLRFDLYWVRGPHRRWNDHTVISNYSLRDAGPVAGAGRPRISTEWIPDATVTSPADQRPARATHKNRAVGIPGNGR